MGSGLDGRNPSYALDEAQGGTAEIKHLKVAK